MMILSVKDIKKSYKSRTIIDNVNLYIKTGEVVGLLGPNGAGKTTIFYIMVGLVSPDKGCVLLNQDDITHMPMHTRARNGIGYLPQEASVFRKLSVEDNILAILELREELSKSERKQKLSNLLEEFHITHLRKSLGLSLSGGERRRLEIARAVAAEPKFILLDEPFAGVDPISVVDIKNIVKQLTAKNIGVLITDHNVRETLDICDRAYIVNNGHTICEGSSDIIIKHPDVITSYLGEEFML